MKLTTLALASLLTACVPGPIAAQQTFNILKVNQISTPLTLQQTLTVTGATTTSGLTTPAITGFVISPIFNANVAGLSSFAKTFQNSDGSFSIDYTGHILAQALGIYPLINTVGLTIGMGGTAGHAADFYQTTSGGTATVLITNGGSDPAIYAGPSWMRALNYIATENGANNAIACSAGSGPALIAGLVVTVQLAHTLQAGANTFAYAGGSAVAIKSHLNTANNLGTAYAATGTVQLVYNGSIWLDTSQ